MRGRGQKSSHARQATPTYPLTRIVFCAHCANKMWGRKGNAASAPDYRRYSCSSYEHNRSCAPNSVDATRFEGALLERVRDNVLPPEGATRQ